MARVLGYGGLANTNGARNFAGRAEAEVSLATDSNIALSMGLGLWSLALIVSRLTLLFRS